MAAGYCIRIQKGWTYRRISGATDKKKLKSETSKEWGRITMLSSIRRTKNDVPVEKSAVCKPIWFQVNKIARNPLEYPVSGF